MTNTSSAQGDTVLPQLDKRAASAAAWLVTADDRLVIVRSDYKTHWSLPGGLIDAGETPLQTVQREVAEEIGVSLASDSYVFRLVVNRLSSRLKKMSYQFIFEASITTEQLQAIVLQTEEIAEFSTVTREDILLAGRPYAPAVYAWAYGERGYAEHGLDA